MTGNIDEGGGLLSRDGNEVDLDDGWGSGERISIRFDVMGRMKWVTLHSSSFCLSAAVAFTFHLPLGFLMIIG